MDHLKGKSKKGFLINGPGGAGKGTFIKMCRLLMQGTMPVYSFSSIKPIKQKLIDDGLWDGKLKTEEFRIMMVELKQKMIAEGDQPVNYCLDSYENIERGISFFHVREASEIEKLENMFNEKFDEDLVTVHYERMSGQLEKLNTGVDLPAQTREYKSYDFDIVNEKDGLEAMLNIVREFLLNFFDAEDLAVDVDLSLLEDDNLHIEYDDEKKAGFV